jgi:modification methylase
MIPILLVYWMAATMSHTRRSTRTSPFGSSGRSSHDSSSFYASRLYADQTEDTTIEYFENPLSIEALDHIFLGSCQDMAQLPENSVHLMVTSPPYNVGKTYDQDLSLPEYLDYLQAAWQEVYRVLVPGGRACINIANLGRKPYLPMNAFITQGMLELGFRMRGEIIWDKGASAAASTAWGSWLSAANPTLRDVHEYILVFSKGPFGRRKDPERPSTISRDEFLEFTKSVWSFPAESARKVGHPAPFPLELPYRLIQLYTFAGEVILDPFMGSGQTALAAIKSKRHYVGYEIDPQYVELAHKRVAEYQR